MPNKNITVAFDVLGTLISISGNIIHPDIVKLFRQFQRMGCHMIIWSGGGRDLAAQTARQLDLKPNTVCEKNHKLQPDIIFDDDEMMRPFGKIFIKV